MSELSSKNVRSHIQHTLSRNKKLPFSIYFPHLKLDFWWLFWLGWFWSQSLKFLVVSLLRTCYFKVKINFTLKAYKQYFDFKNVIFCDYIRHGIAMETLSETNIIFAAKIHLRIPEINYEELYRAPTIWTIR